MPLWAKIIQVITQKLSKPDKEKSSSCDHREQLKQNGKRSNKQRAKAITTGKDMHFGGLQESPIIQRWIETANRIGEQERACTRVSWNRETFKWKLPLGTRVFYTPDFQRADMNLCYFNYRLWERARNVRARKWESGQEKKGQRIIMLLSIKCLLLLQECKLLSFEW